MSEPVISTESVPEFFRAAFTAALARERETVSVMAEWYVVNLLTSQTAQGYHPDEHLEERLGAALRTAVGSAERIRSLREVGDGALVICGLWWERDEHPRRPRFMDDYRNAGRFAYHHLGRFRDPDFGIGNEVFAELAEKFPRLVDALVRLGTDHRLASHRDIVRLYRLWAATRSRVAGELLMERGIVPLLPTDTTPS